MKTFTCFDLVSFSKLEDYTEFYHFVNPYFNDEIKRDRKTIYAPSEKVEKFIKELCSYPVSASYVKEFRLVYFKFEDSLSGYGFITGDKEFLDFVIKSASCRCEFDGELKYNIRDANYFVYGSPLDYIK